MQPIAIISGLVGALVSAILGFVVRLILDKRAQRESERRLAYIHLVKVSDVVAADIAVRTVVKPLIPQDAFKELVERDKASFGPSHKLSAMLAEALNKLTKEAIEANPNLKAIPRLARTQLEAAKEFKLTAEQLSKLPKDVVFLSNRLQGLHSHVMQCIDMWGALFEQDERYWITPEGIHDQWMSVVRFASTARELRLALIRYGASTPKEAADLLSLQVSYLIGIVSTKWSDQPKLAAAAAAESSKAASNEPVV